MGTSNLYVIEAPTVITLNSVDQKLQYSWRIWGKLRFYIILKAHKVTGIPLSQSPFNGCGGSVPGQWEYEGFSVEPSRQFMLFSVHCGKEVTCWFYRARTVILPKLAKMTE